MNNYVMKNYEGNYSEKTAFIALIQKNYFLTKTAPQSF